MIPFFLKFTYQNVFGKDNDHHVFVMSADHLKDILERYNLGLKNIFNISIDGEEAAMNQLLERLGFNHG